MRLVILNIFILIFSGLTFSQNWILKKNKDGIKIFTPEKQPKSGYKFKGEAFVNASKEKIVNFISQTNLYPKWIENVSASKLVQKNKDGFIVWYKIKMPLGFNDRDIVLLNKISKIDKQTIKITLTSEAEKYPKQKNVVRIENASGYWLISEEKGKTKVIYEFYNDPKINLPDWLINQMLVESPFNTLKNLKKNVEPSK